MLSGKIATSSLTLMRAKELRRSMTSSEALLWKHLCNRKCHGLKFRRQVPLGPYIVDFFCREAALVVELDGDSHYEDGAAASDERRSAFFRNQGLRVLRFNNGQVHDAVTWVVSTIGSVACSIADRPPEDFRR